MRAVWKWSFVDQGTVIDPDIPVGGDVVHVGIDPATGGDPAIWVEVDPTEKQTERRVFRLVMTGQPVSGSYVGTVKIGAFMLHVYEGSS